MPLSVLCNQLISIHDEFEELFVTKYMHSMTNRAQSKVQRILYIHVHPIPIKWITKHSTSQLKDRVQLNADGNTKIPM